MIPRSESLVAELSEMSTAASAVSLRQWSPVPGWPRLPPGVEWTEVAAVAADSNDRIYLFHRSEPPVLVFDVDGNFLRSWGEGLFTRPHGLTIGPDDCLYFTDDLGHTVRKFSPDGRLLMTLGTPGRPSDTGATSIDYRTIRHSGPPFHFPTNVALAKNGDLYVTDGYGNARVHHFSADGTLRHSWGRPGAGPGEFHVPHGIAIRSDGAVVVADRENDRLQVFSPEGEFLSEQVGVARPCQITFDAAGNLFVAELGYRSGMWPGTHPPHEGATGGRVSVFDPLGNLRARWGGGDDPTAPGDFYAPHDIALDSRGNVYVAEVVLSAGGARGLVARGCHTVQKFAPVLRAEA